MNIIKRTAVTLLSGVVLATSLTSCNLFKKLSMGEMINEMTSFENYSEKMSFNFNLEDNSFDLAFDGQVSKTNISADNITIKTNINNIDEEEIYDGVEASVNNAINNLDLSMKDSIKYVDGNMYFNIESMFDAFKKISGDNINIDFDIKSLGAEWINIPMDLEFNKMQESSKEFSDTFSKSIEDIIKSSETKIEKDGDNGYKITVKDNAQFAKIAGELAKNLKDNKDTYLSQYKSAFESFDYKVLFDKIIDIMVDAMKSLCDKLEVNYTDDDLAKIKNLMTEEMNNSISEDDFKMANEDWDEIKKGYDEMVSEIEKAQKEIADSKDEVVVTYTVSLEGRKGSRVGKQKLSIDVKDDKGESGKIGFEFVITENDKSVEAPKDSKKVGELAGNILDYLVDKGMVPKEQLELFKGANLSDLLNEVESGYNGYDDEDFYYEDTDYTDLDLDDATNVA